MLLPVYNAQASVAQAVVQLLEILPDLTSEFVLRVVDDGSTDATSEAAFEVARHYPQVEIFRQATRQGSAAAIRTGLLRDSRPWVLIRDEGCELDAHELDKLWRAKESHDAALARRRRSLPATADEELRLNVWKMRLPVLSPDSEVHGWQLYRRPAIEAVAMHTSSRRELLTELSRRKYRWTEIELASNRAASCHKSLGAAGPRRIDPSAHNLRPTSHTFRAWQTPSIKDLALGE